MADYFTHFSCLLDVGTPENAARALDLYIVAGVAEEEGEDPESFFITWSPERADELDSDILISWAMSEDVRQAIESDDLLNKIPAVADGKLMLQVDAQETLSVSAISPLSLPWALETVLPQIVATLEGGSADAEASPSA